MGFWNGVKDFFVGADGDKYTADKTASTMNGAYGSTGNLQGLATDAMGRAAPTSTAANAGPASTTTAAQINTGNYDPTRARQLGLADLLTGAARGEGPSGAGLAAQAQRDAALSQASALQAGRRGRSAVAGAQMGTLAAQMGNQQASQNEAIGRANEMATARGQLGNTLGQVAGQDIGIAGQNAGFGQQAGMFNAGQLQNMAQYNAGLNQQTNLANQNAQLQQTGLNQNLALGANGQLQNQAQAEMAARMQQEQMAFGNLNPGSQGLLSPQTLVTGGATAAMLMSDANAKVGIQPIGGGPDRQQYIGPGMRQAPVRRSAGDYGNAIGTALTDILLSKAMEKKDQGEKAQKEYKAAQDRGLQDKGGLTSMFNQVRGQVTDPNSPVYGQSPDDLMAQYRMLGVQPQPGVVMSDERSKKDAREMFSKLTPYQYEYRPEAVAAGQQPGPQMGIMWQQLQKSEAGRAMDGGRDPATGYHQVDYLKGLPTAFAALADLNKRVSKVEGRKK